MNRPYDPEDEPRYHPDHIDDNRNDNRNANPGKAAFEKPTAYTIMDKANARLAAQELLITGQEVKVLLDGIVKVGTSEGRNMVFNKWEAANRIAQIVNDRFNARRK